MSACHKVQKAVSAYVDGEASHSERVAIEQHVHECTTCAALVRRQRALAGELFNLFEEHRRSRDLRSPVLSHLPEMDMTAREVEAVNYRAKHPRRIRARATRWVPLFAGGIVIVLGLALRAYWPDSSIPADRLAVAAYVEGEVSQITHDGVAMHRVQERVAFQRDDTLATGDDGVVLSASTDGSQVTLGHRSRAKFLQPRHIRLESGRVYLDVREGAELFRVNTSEAIITVFGTAFEVAVQNGETTVTVHRGIVFVESVSDPTRFRSVHENEQVKTRHSSGPDAPIEVDASEWVAWATLLNPDPEILSLYTNPPSEQAVAEHQGIPHFISATRNVNGVRIAWDLEDTSKACGDHIVYISEYGGDSIAQYRVPGQIFSQPGPMYDGKVYYQVPIDPSSLEGRGLIDVKIVPVPQTRGDSPEDLVVLFTVP